MVPLIQEWGFQKSEAAKETVQTNYSDFTDVL